MGPGQGTSELAATELAQRLELEWERECHQQSVEDYHRDDEQEAAALRLNQSVLGKGLQQQSRG